MSAMSLNNDDRNWMESLFAGVYKKMELDRVEQLREIGEIRTRLEVHMATPIREIAIHEETHHAVGWPKLCAIWLAAIGGLVGLMSFLFSIYHR
jgi:hypothetical protein